MDLTELVRSCPHCGGPVIYEQKLQYVRQGKASIGLVEPKQGQLIIRETVVFASATRPTGRTLVFCENDDDCGKYLGSVPARHWSNL